MTSRGRSSTVRLASKIACALLAGDITGLIGTPQTPLERPGIQGEVVDSLFVIRRARWVIAAVVLGGCVGGGAKTGQPPVTAIAPALVDPASVSGTAVPTDANPTRLDVGSETGAATTTIIRTTYQLGLDTPEAAAKNLWDSWRDDDRSRALIAADEQAVNTLFADSWGPEVDEQGCIAVVTDVRYRCAFVQGNAARIIEVSLLAGRYRVTGVQRIGELATSAGPQVGNRAGPVGGPTVVPITQAPRPKPRNTSDVSGVSGVSSAETTVATGAAEDTTPPSSKRPRTRSTVAPGPAPESPVASAAPTPVPVQARAAESSVG